MKPFTVDQPDIDFKPVTITINTPELLTILAVMIGRYDGDNRHANDLYVALCSLREGYDHD